MGEKNSCSVMVTALLYDTGKAYQGQVRLAYHQPRIGLDKRKVFVPVTATPARPSFSLEKRVIKFGVEDLPADLQHEESIARATLNQIRKVWPVFFERLREISTSDASMFMDRHWGNDARDQYLHAFGGRSLHYGRLSPDIAVDLAKLRIARIKYRNGKAPQAREVGRKRVLD